MPVVVVDERRALLPPEIDYRGELDAFVAGVQPAAVPPVGGGGLLVNFDGEGPEEVLAVLEGGIGRRFGAGVAFRGPASAKYQECREKKEG